jgi:hypothetical protein
MANECLPIGTVKVVVCLRLIALSTCGGVGVVLCTILCSTMLSVTIIEEAK